MRAFFVALKNQLAKERVGPGEPGPGKLGGVIFIKGFMDEAGAGMGLLQGHEALAHFLVVRAGERLHDQAERPDHVPPHVRSSRSRGGLAGDVIGVAVRQDELAGVEIEGVAGADCVEIRQGQQAGVTGVVNAVRVAVAIYLIGQNAPILDRKSVV